MKVLAAVVASGALVALTVAQLSAPQLTGDWEGDSKCVNLVAAPACKDEHVIFHITRDLDKFNHPVPNGILVRADKIVNKKHLTMGYLDFKLDAANFTISTFYTKNKSRGAWIFTVKGNTMTGSLTKLPDNVVIRKVTLKKKK